MRDLVSRLGGTFRSLLESSRTGPHILSCEISAHWIYKAYELCLLQPWAQVPTGKTRNGPPTVIYSPEAIVALDIVSGSVHSDYTAVSP